MRRIGHDLPVGADEPDLVLPRLERGGAQHVGARMPRRPSTSSTSRAVVGRDAASGVTRIRSGPTPCRSSRSSAVASDGTRIRSARRAAARTPARYNHRHVGANASGKTSNARSCTVATSAVPPAGGEGSRHGSSRGPHRSRRAAPDARSRPSAGRSTGSIRSPPRRRSHRRHRPGTSAGRARPRAPDRALESSRT